jgi:hypothetical protein
VLIVAAFGGAALTDRFVPARPPQPPGVRPVPVGGVWACPFLKAAGGPGWLHLANVGRGPATVRVTYVPDGRKPVGQDLAVPAGRAVTVPVPASIRQAAGPIVEFSGGDVVVSRTAFLTATPATGITVSGGAAAACGRPGPAITVIPQGSTLRSDVQIVLLNPGTADAVVDIVMLAGGRQVQPESLRRRIVPARGRLVLRAGDFAFDERALAIAVRARSGRVVAEGLFMAQNLVEIIPAVPPVIETVALASSDRGAATFAAVAIGEADAVSDARLMSSAGRGAFDPLTAGLAPSTVNLNGPPSGTPAGALGLAVSSSTTPVVIGARWLITGRPGVLETAASTGSVPANRAVAVVGPPADSSRLRLLLANPDGAAALVDVALVTESGVTTPAALQGVRIEPGHTAVVRIPGIAPTASVAVVVTSRGGRIVGLIEAFARRPEGFGAYAIEAVPSIAPPLVAVVPDQRIGLPAS